MEPTHSDLMAADDLPATLGSRRHERWPRLTGAELARIRRFSTLRDYARGERLLTAGERGPGMFVIVKGAVTISQRDVRSGSVKRVGAAIGEGAAVVALIHQYLAVTAGDRNIQRNRHAKPS